MPGRLTGLLALVALASPAACGDATNGAAEPNPTSAAALTTSSTTTAAAVPSTAALDVVGALDAERARYGAPGALALVRHGDHEWFGASGTADLAGEPITEDTTFRIASITKPIVAALMLDAVARGEVSLDDVVGELLPGVLRSDPPVSVRMLLDHTSGIVNEGDDGDLVADIAKLTDPALKDEANSVAGKLVAGEPATASDRLLVALAETNDRYFAPGTGYEYSNINYQLAAMVLERVTGAPLAALLRERIVEPLGLRYTAIVPGDPVRPELHGYGTTTADGSLVDITDDLLPTALLGNGGSGGIVSTAGELLTIMQAIASGRLVPPPLLEDMLHPTAPSGGSYGLGLATYYLSCGTFHGHEGGLNGTASIAIVAPEGGQGVVIALNLRSGADPKLPALADELLCASA
jgi:D-alanyl-D-alanine carboxypeptidase